MFANNVFNLVTYLLKDGKIKLDMEDDITKSILVTHNNEIVHEGAREAMGI
jgi:NAD(P) transhydrogenase subunit alpha